MKQLFAFINSKGILFFAFLILLSGTALYAQQTTIKDYVLFGANASSTTGFVQLGSSSNVQGGSVGSYKLVKSTGNATINANIYSGGTVILANSNSVTGKITAANSPVVSGTILSVGSSANLSGNIDVNGKITVSGGTVSGRVTHPTGTTYTGPVPGGGNITGPPTLPGLPQMPAITSFPPFPNIPDINSTTSITPGYYDDIKLSGNKTLTFYGTGVYVFDLIANNNSTNNFVFDFRNNSTGTFKIYIHNDADLGKINVSMINGGSASRIYTEIHGNGSSISGGYCFNIANGSSGGAATKWLGTVWAPNASINIGSGTGNSSITGALWSGNQVNIQSGVNIIYAPFFECSTPDANAGIDKPLNFAGQTTLTGSSATAGVTLSWQALNGGTISSPANAATISVSSSGTYVLTATLAAGCYATDTAIVTARVDDIIGSELESVFQNFDINNPSSPFFVISNDSIMIDVIVKENQYAAALNILTNQPYGLTGILSNGGSTFVITGMFKISKLPSLNSLITYIDYVRPYYKAVFKSGIVSSAGDISLRSNLVRNGYNLTGDGIKVGVISNSYSTITTATTNPITNTAAQDIGNGDLPGAGNPDGDLLPVHMVKEYPFKSTDEGRAMLQIVHDIAPKAELYFRSGYITAGDFAKGITDLRDSGCNIIVDDLTYITEPFLQDGIVAQAVDAVTATGTSYFSAAGNFANKSYENTFNAAPAPGGITGKAHDFGGGDYFQSVTFRPGKYMIVLQWLDDFYSQGQTAIGGTKNDLDIYLTPNTDGTALVGYNRNNINGDPIEFILLDTNITITTNIFIVNKTAATNPARIKYIIISLTGDPTTDITFNQFATTGNSTIFGHSNAAGAITVGAVRYDKAPPFASPVTESFSSIGGTVMGALPRNKPDLVAPDGVNTTVKMGQDFDAGSTDGYSNFFGTSAAAPHAAAVAALIMEGKKKYSNHPVTTSAEIKSILQSSATDMYTAGFDFQSGYGFINADSAMRTFAKPDPALIHLVIPSSVTTPGTSTFILTVTGFNFSPTSVIRFRDSTLVTTYVNSNTLTAVIPAFIGDPAISVYTSPISLSGLDGGSSDTLKFFAIVKKNITVIADNKTKKYAQQLPLLSATVLVDGDSLQHTTLTMADLGLSSLNLTTLATAGSNIGTYNIIPSRVFDAENPVDIGYKELYNYTFVNGNISVEKLPVTVIANDVNVTYGEKIPDIEFTYEFDPTNIPDPAAFLNSLESAHQAQIAKDALGNDILGLVNGQAVTIVNGQAIPIVNGQAVTIVNGQAVTIVNGQAVPIVNGQAITIVNGQAVPIVNNLTESDVQNLSFLASTPSIGSSREITNKKLVNGIYETSSTEVVDITQESILDFNVNSAQTTMLSSVSETSPKGLVDKTSFANGQAITIVNGQAVTIVNGQAVTIVNGQAVTIVNGQAVTIVNGQAVPIVNGQDKTAVVLNESEIGNGQSELKSLNMITGIDVGEQFIIPGSFVNENLQITNIAGNVTISPALVTITATAGQTKVYGDNDPVLSYTNNAGLAANEFTGTLGRESGSAVGNYAYTLGSLSAGSNYTLVLGGSNTFEITARPVTITPNAGQNKVYGNNDPTFEYTASEALQTGDSYIGALGRAPGETVAGSPYTYTLGSLSAGDNYTLILGGSNTFAITRRPLIITPNPGQSKVYGNLDPTFTYTASEALMAGNSYSGALERAQGETVAGGPYTYTLGTLSAGNNYTLSLGGSNSFAITARPVTITPNAGQNKVYGNLDPTFAYTASEALQAGNSYSGLLGRVLGETVAGGPYTYTLGTLSAGNNYTLSLGGSNSFAITARPVTITANAGQSKVYGNLDPTFAYTASEALQAGNSYSGSLGRAPGETVAGGPYSFTLGSLSAGNNYTLSLGGSNSFAITARPVTITANAGQSKVYGNLDPTFTYTASETLQAGNSFSGTLGRAAGETVAGSPYAYTIGSLSAGNNYTLTLSGSNTFAITRKQVIITATAGQSKLYGDNDPVFTYTNDAGLAAGSFTGTLGRVSGSNAGSYAYTIGTLSAGNNYSLSLSTTNTFTINKVPLQVKAADKFISKGDALPAYTSTITGLKNGDNPTVAYTLSPAYSGAAGVYSIIPSISAFANSVNYAITYINGSLYVNPKGTGTDDVDVYLECVEDRGASYVPSNRRYVARFYSKNTNSVPVYVPIGTNNKLSSTGSFDGSLQAIVFMPGNGTTRFNVPFDGTSLKWELRTYEVNTIVLESVTASKNSNKCTTTAGRSADPIITETEVQEPEKATVTEVIPGTNVHVYPNPAKDRATIFISNEQINEKGLSLFDTYGRSYAVKVTGKISGQSVEIDLSQLISGMYFMRVKLESGYKTICILKE